VIFRETGDRYGEGHALAKLGLAYYGWQQFEQAIALYRDALMHFRAIQYPGWIQTSGQETQQPEAGQPLQPSA